MCTVLDQLKSVIHQVDDGGCSPAPCAPACPPQGCPMVSCMPFAQVLISRPPPILAPTRPQPVTPLRLPCPPCKKPRQMTEEEALRWRYSNFYNNYNIDWHATVPCNTKPKCRAPAGTATCWGADPCCPRPCTAPPCCGDSCPTGFKTCRMRMIPPPCWDPCGVWCAEIQKCPPKPRKKVSYWYKPGPCTRPCCLHWRPKEPPCCYDAPCRAHCYDHPVGIKPSRKYPCP